MISKEKIIEVNRVFGGRVYNPSNLDFEVNMANKQKNVFKKVAHIVRATTSGHSFENANKRTALVVVKGELADEGIKCDQKKLARALVNLAKKQETRINIIERRIRRACGKKIQNR